MKVKTIDGRKVLVVTYRGRATYDDSWDEPETINVFRLERKIVLSHYYTPETIHGHRNANVAAGPKTLVRLFQDALDGKIVKSRKGALADTYYADEATLRLERKGNRVLFTAPCGQEGYITVREAEKLVELLPTL